MEEIEDANKDAIRSCHRLLNLLSHHQDRVHCESLVAETDEAVFKFRKVISMLSNNLNGEMRVKQKSQPSCPQKSLDYSHTESDQFVYRNTPQTLTSTLETSMKNSVQVLSKYTNGNPPMENDSSCKTFLQLMSQEPINQLKITQPKVEQTTSFIQMKFQSDTISEGSNSGINIKFDGYPYSSMSTISSKRSLTSSLSIDGSMSNQDSNGFHLISAAQVSDQNTQSCKKRCLGLEHGKEKCVTSGKCHCSKKRKLRIKRSIKVPSISNKIADIPPDDYSWRKYGQKPIKGSPYPRGYYKCSTMRGCAARKHVERCLDEPSMLMVTYEGEHNHSTLTSDSPKQQGMTDMNESVVQRDYPLAEYRL